MQDHLVTSRFNIIKNETMKNENYIKYQKDKYSFDNEIFRLQFKKVNALAKKSVNKTVPHKCYYG